MLKKGYLQLALAMIFVGSSFVVAKELTNSIPVFVSNSLRFVIAAVAMLPLLGMRKQEVKRISKSDLSRLLLLALTGVFLFNVLLFIGLRYINASTSGIITSAAPMVIAALSFLLLKESMSPKKIAAIIVASAGILVVNLFGSETATSNSNHWLGFALIFGVVLCEAAFTLLAKSVSKNVKPEIMTGVVVCLSCLLFLPFGIGQALQANDLTITVKDWLLIAYLGLIVNAITYFLWYSGLKKVTATQAAVFTGIMPISSVTLAFLLLDEPLHIASVVGLMLVFVGIALVTQADRKKSPAKLEAS